MKDKEIITRISKMLERIHNELATCDMLDHEYDSISSKMIKTKSEVYKLMR